MENTVQEIKKGSDLNLLLKLANLLWENRDVVEIFEYQHYKEGESRGDWDNEDGWGLSITEITESIFDLITGYDPRFKQKCSAEEEDLKIWKQKFQIFAISSGGYYDEAIEGLVFYSLVRNYEFFYGSWSLRYTLGTKITNPSSEMIALFVENISKSYQLDEILTNEIEKEDAEKAKALMKERVKERKLSLIG